MCQQSYYVSSRATQDFCINSAFLANSDMGALIFLVLIAFKFYYLAQLSSSTWINQSGNK